MIETILLTLQIVLAIVFVVLMAVQTERAQQSGIMGLGGQGGRMGGEIDMPVGAERILKPLTKWVVVAFLITCVMSALEMNENVALSWYHVVLGVVVFSVVVGFGDRLWDGFLRMLGAGR